MSVSATKFVGTGQREFRAGRMPCEWPFQRIDDRDLGRLRHLLGVEAL